MQSRRRRRSLRVAFVRQGSPQHHRHLTQRNSQSYLRIGGRGQYIRQREGNLYQSHTSRQSQSQSIPQKDARKAKHNWAIWVTEGKNAESYYSYVLREGRAGEIRGRAISTEDKRELGKGRTHSTRPV